MCASTLPPTTYFASIAAKIPSIRAVNDRDWRSPLMDRATEIRETSSRGRGDAPPEARIQYGGYRHQHAAPPLPLRHQTDMRRQSGRLAERCHDIDGTRPAASLGEAVADRYLVFRKLHLSD